MSDVRPVDVAQRTFRVAFRGFDQEEVRRYLTELGTEIQRLGDESEALAARLEQTSGRDQDFDALSHEIGQILTTAKEAADGLRRRAAEEVARWRSEAQAEVTEHRQSSARDSEAMRTDAWVTSSELLNHAQQMSASIIDEAEQEAAAVRSAAEREALALTGQTERDTHRMLASARRESEELLRLGKMESERLLAEARAEHEEIIEIARKSAEASQERARALEVRRAEMLEELESVRKTVAKVESDLENKRTALEQAVLEPEPEASSTVRVLPPEADDKPNWSEESVRIIPAQRVDQDDDTDTVDAAVIADEVRRMREKAAVDTLAAEIVNGRPGRSPESAPSEDGVTGDQSAGASGDDLPPTVEPLSEADVDAPERQPDPGVVASDHDGGDDQLPAGDSPAEEGPVEDSPAEDSPVEDSPAEDSPAEDTPAEDGGAAEEEVFVDDSVPDALVGLFASLRDTKTKPTEPVVEASSEGEEPHATDRAQAENERVGSDPALPPGLDAMELRDQLVLPITNRILRSVKRQLTEAQNIALEEIRVADGVWAPSVGELAAELRGDFVVLAQESLAAGYAGVENMGGETAGRPKPMPEDIVQYSDEFAAALLESLTHHVEGVDGPRQVSAVVSRTYRVWRTDEAERRLRGYARSSYHRGVSRALATLGTPRMIWLVAGRGCPDCRTMAEHGAVSPHAGFGDDQLVPPLHDECSCTIVPSV